MKKIFIPIFLLLYFTNPLYSQEPSTEQKEPVTEFDRKFRFGLRITPQPTWFSSGDKNSTPKGASLGFGFGLNMERRLSPVVSFLTGIGGDFETGKYSVRYDPANNYVVKYWMDQSNEFIAPKKGNMGDANTTVYTLKERVVKTTYITVPLMMKLSTQEYGGLKYFGMFGGELGFRVKTTGDDTYADVRKYANASDTVGKVLSTGSTQTDINMAPESGFFMRFGMNAGLGAEYRIAGGTSLLFSLNYFRSFTNLMDKTSEHTYFDVTNGDYKFIKQELKMTAIRINIGVMF